MPLKTYETIGILNRYITASIDGKDVSIYFINGTSSPRLIQGRYTTSNPKIQEYLETSYNFNKKYRLVATVITPSEKQVSPVKDKPKKPYYTEEGEDKAFAPPHLSGRESVEDDMATLPGSIMGDTDEDILPDPDLDEMSTPTDTGITVVGESVVNGQQARNYLMERYKDLTFRQLQNNTQIISEAKDRGVQFTHWEAFVTSK